MFQREGTATQVLSGLGLKINMFQLIQSLLMCLNADREIFESESDGACVVCGGGKGNMRWGFLETTLSYVLIQHNVVLGSQLTIL